MRPGQAQSGPGGLLPLWALRGFLAPHRAVMLSALLALLGAVAATLALPVGIRSLVEAEGTGSRVFLALAAIALLLAVCSALRYYLVTWLGERVSTELRKKLYATVIGMGPSFHLRHPSGELLSRLGNDAMLVQNVLTSMVPVALRNLLLLVGSLIMMLVSSPVQGIQVLLLVPIVVAPIILLGRRVRGFSRLSQDCLASSSGFAGETLAGLQTVQAYNLEQHCTERYATLSERSFHAARARSRYRALLTGLAILLVAIAVLGVLWSGAREVAAGDMSGGALGQFLLYAVLLTAAIGGISEVWGELQRAAGAAERLQSLLQARPEVRTPTRPRHLPEPGSGRVEFRQVGFCYPNRPERQVLDNFTLQTEPGTTVALVGPTGAGKSTVFRLLLRFFEIHIGTILLDGVDICTVAPAEVRARIGLVPQETVLFSGSILDNIRCGRLDAGEGAALQAGRLAGLESFVLSLPEGYDTRLGERGTGLSGGQQQCIAMARAILKAPCILLLDEATSALDAESEHLVQNALAQLSQGRTTLIIAHRLSTVRRADRIVVLEQGHIEAIGTHQELLDSNPLYARLARFQLLSDAVL